jgi:hypothetical protein
LTEDPGRKKNLEEDEDAAEDDANAQDGVEAPLVQEEEARVRVEGVAYGRKEHSELGNN